MTVDYPRRWAVVALCIVVTGCSKSAETTQIERSSNDAPPVQEVAGSATSAPLDAVDTWYHLSPVFIQGPGFDECLEIPSVPAALWGNSRPVQTTEAISSDGAVLTINGTYEDNGESTTYRIYRNRERCVIDGGSQARSPRVKRGENFQPFSLVSSKTGEVITSDFIETRLMCRNPIESLEINARLIKDFDSIGVGGDSSLGMVSFVGRRNDQAVEVTFATTTNPPRLAYVFVGNETAFSCEE